MKVLFLDRDGIVNKERGDYTWLKEQFEFTEGLMNFLKSKRDQGFQFVVVTNQGGIEKGLYQHEDVLKLHEWMKDELRKNDISILDIFYCPHHSDFQKCLCRKPNSLLFEKAIFLHEVDVKSSYMIGDRQRDVDAAEKVNIKGILINSNPDWSKVNLNLT